MKMTLRLVNADGSVSVRSYSGPLPAVNSEFWFSSFVRSPKLWRVTRIRKCVVEPLNNPDIDFEIDEIDEIDVYLEPV